VYAHVVLLLLCIAPAAAQVAAAGTNTTAFPAAAIASSLVVADAIASWTALDTSITAAAGKAATLTLSATFDMGGFKEIVISTAQTHITIIGNGATFDAGGSFGNWNRFFTIGKDVAMVMSHVTLTNVSVLCYVPHPCCTLTPYTTYHLTRCTRTALTSSYSPPSCFPPHSLPSRSSI
jgi:hypothetical protein